MNDEELYQKTLNLYDDPAFAVKYAQNIEPLIDLWTFDQFTQLLSNGSSILDAGCAAGRDSAYLQSKGYAVTGVDMSSELIKIAKQKYPNINFVQGDFTQMHFGNNSFDGLWCHAGLVHMQSQKEVKKALLEFHRVLKPTAYIMIQTKAYFKGNKPTAIKVDKLSNKERYFRYQEQEDFLNLCQDTGFEIVKSKVFNEGQDQDHPGDRDENWLFVIGKKK